MLIFAEAGLPGYETGSWYGVLAPAGTPELIVALLNARFGEAPNTSDMRNHLLAMGAEAVGGSPQVFGALIESKLARYGATIRQIGVRPE